MSPYLPDKLVERSKPTSPIVKNPTKAAKPTKTLFDPWNSSSTGHQRAENRLGGSTSWRHSRSAKLGEQFKDGQRGGKRMWDTVGAGSEGFGVDGRLENGGWERGAKGLRTSGQLSILEATDKQAYSKSSSDHASTHESKRKRIEYEHASQEPDNKDGRDIVSLPDSPNKLSPEKQIFRGLTIYINGSTFPLISDHKLKKVLAERGAHLSIALGRRTVTHVILGSSNSNGNGAGGGLASSKLQKEITNIRGKGVKFVGVEWVLESVKADRRLPEARFGCLKMASAGQKSVFGMMKKDDEDAVTT